MPQPAPASPTRSHDARAPDPLCWHGATRARNATEYLLATGACLAAMPEYAFPFVVFHGADDTLCDVDGSRQLFQRAKVPHAHSQPRHGWHCAR
jgi:alpha-beta hydrolase superfamily lysophospholipase